MEGSWLGGDKEPTEEDWQVYYFEIPELFSPGSPINEADLLAGRSTEIRRLVETAMQRGKHAVVFGERGVGKTSLVNTFHKKIIPPHARVSAFRIQCHKNDDFTSIWRKVFRRLERNIDGESLNLSDAYPGEIAPDDVLLELS